VILRYIERYHFLQDLGVEAIDLSPISAPMIRYFADVTKHYDVRALRRFPEAKRYALTTCFLVETHKTILDHIVALHDQLLTKKMREATNAFEQHYRRLRRQYRPSRSKERKIYGKDTDQKLHLLVRAFLAQAGSENQEVVEAQF
jgi:hypothetical protein